MERKPNLDMFGAVALTGFSVLLGLNQVVIKLTNTGIQPVFGAGLRSAGGIVCLLLWMAWRRIPAELQREYLAPGLLIGSFFALEFIGLFLALDLTTVARVSIIFYSMPVWLALAAHVLIPEERLTTRKTAGLALAVAGVAWAMGGGAGSVSITGDLLALAAAMLWAGIALLARRSRLSELRPEVQLLWQLVVSAPILILAAVLFGPLLRDPTPWHWAGLGFQTVAVVSAGFLFWFWLLTVYPASSVASFSFVTPVIGVALGWLLLDEPLGPSILGGLVLVCAGLVLINRPKRS